MTDQATDSLSFVQKRELQRSIIEQKKVIASETASAFEKDEASRIKAEALVKLGVVTAAFRADGGVMETLTL